MEHEDSRWLIEALTSGNAADEACGAALEGGGVLTIWDAPVSVADLAVIYRRRVRHLLAGGTTLLGEDVAERLVASGRGMVRLGMVSQPGWHFQLFLGYGIDDVVSCVGVPQP